MSVLRMPRSVRRAMHPVRTARRAATPKAYRRAKASVTRPVRAAQSPFRSGALKIDRAMDKAWRDAGKSYAQVYTHGTCIINHRTPETAAKCRKGGSGGGYRAPRVSAPAPAKRKRMSWFESLKMELGL